MDTSHRMLSLNRACRNRITTCKSARSIGIIALLVSFCLTPIGSVSAGLPDGWRYEATFPTGANINAVWAAAPNDVFVGGDGGVILRWDGTTWHTMNTPSQYDINAIHGTGPMDCVDIVLGGSVHGVPSGAIPSEDDAAVPTDKDVIGCSGPDGVDIGAGWERGLIAPTIRQPC